MYFPISSPFRKYDCAVICLWVLLEQHNADRKDSVRVLHRIALSLCLFLLAAGSLLADMKGCYYTGVIAGSYAEGEYAITINYSELNDCINPAGPPQRFLKK